MLSDSQAPIHEGREGLADEPTTTVPGRAPRWVGPAAMLLAFGLGFLMVATDYESGWGWLAVITALVCGTWLQASQGRGLASTTGRDSGDAKTRAAQATSALMVAVVGLCAFAAAASAQSETTEERIRHLENQVDDLHTIVELVLGPIAILVAVLALGGVLGVVFSIRDQSRISQLHELSVTGELSSQRRADQSYGSFLEESQKTLTLVNETLSLAKEATDQAAQTMSRKADANLKAIEEKAEELVLDVAESSDYEELIDVATYRSRVQAIADELALLEGYMRLQDIDPQPYSRFVSGLDRYLVDDTTGALLMLRRPSQDSTKRQLRRIALYWVGKLHSALGDYDKALNNLRSAREDIDDANSLAACELERAIVETEFFKEAAASSAVSPAKRFDVVDEMLIRLVPVAKQVDVLVKSARNYRPSHEVAATRAEMYMWVAHDPTRLYNRLPAAAIETAQHAADGLVELDAATRERSTDLIPLLDPAEAKQAKALWELDDDAQRAWAIAQAHAIYKAQHHLHEGEGIDFEIVFGRAECDFKLRHLKKDIDLKASSDEKAEDVVAEYRNVEQKTAESDLGMHREHKRKVELAQIALIGKARLLYFQKESGAGDRTYAEDQVNAASAKLIQEITATREHEIKFASQLHHANIPRDALFTEAGALVEQALRGRHEH